MARRGGSTWLAKHFGPKCRPTLKSVPLNSGVARGFDHRTVEAWKAFSEVLIAARYHVRSKDTGTYNCRSTASGFPSPHSWGTALDLNWQTNPATGGPYGGPNKVVTDMPAEMVQAIKAIRTKGGQQVFGWGGDYTSFKDAMHFEILATPGELAQGIDWTTVKLALRDPSDPATWPLLSVGDRGPAVLELQHRLRDAGYLVAVDGDFGPQTEAAVRTYQTDRGLSVDGMVGLQTWTALLHGMAKLEPDDAGPVKDQPSTPDYAVAVRYGQDRPADERMARMLGAALHIHVAPATAASRVGVVYLVGGKAAEEFDRSLADEVFEVVGKTRQDTLDRVCDIISDYLKDL